MDAGARFEPRTRDDQRVHERPLHAIEDRRLMPFTDDPEWNQHHPCAEVETSGHEEVDVGLLELELAALFETLDNGVLQLEFANEPYTARETVVQQHDEPMKVDPAVLPLILVDMEIHVAGEGPSATGG